MINTSPLLNYVSSNHDIKAINQWRSDVENQLQESFDHGQSIRDVILTRSNMTDEALIFLWKYAKLDQTDLSLFAVGGYGRREMLLYSDVDIMILSEDEFSEEQEKLISVFISSLWDVGNFKPKQLATSSNAAGSIPPYRIARHWQAGRVHHRVRSNRI